MIAFWPMLVYGLCFVASIICAYLLIRAWGKTRLRLLAWTSLAFVFFALNNLALVTDLLIFPDAYLWPFRFVPSFLGVCVLLYGFIWESGR